MEVPSEVRDAIRPCVMEHLENPQAAIDTATKAVRNLPDFACLSELPESVGVMVNHGIARVVYEIRATEGRSIKKEAVRNETEEEAGESVRKEFYAGPPKVLPTGSAMARAARSVYDIPIGSKTLGSLKAADIVKLADDTASVRKSATAWERLYLWILPLVKKSGKSVKESIHELELKEKIREFEREANTERSRKAS